MNKFYFSLFAAFIIFACSKNNDTVILPPEISVLPELSTSYYQHGESPIPQVKWNGNQGKFGLENTLSGLSINTETGQLSWNSSLPIGVHTITLFAYNNAGKGTASITLNNIFQGTFKGTYGSRYISIYGARLISIMEITFNSDGTFSGYTQTENDNGNIKLPYYFIGNYVLKDSKIKATTEDSRFEAVLDQQGKLNGEYIPQKETIFYLNFKIPQ